MKNDLLSYVETVMELEKTVYTQSQLQQELKKKIGSLGIPHTIQPPTKETADLSSNLYACAFIGGLICIVLGGLLGLFSGDGIFSAIFGLIEYGIIGAIVGVIGGLIVGLVLYFFEIKKCNDDYSDDYDSYKRELENDRTRVNKEKEQAKQLQKMVVALGAKRAETEELLQQYYDINVIHRDYRNIQGACAIFEYLEKGICTELGGYYGVYAQLKKDERIHIIEMKLDTILASLESIRSTNLMLYNAIQEGNRNVKQLIEKTDRQIRLAERNNELLAINNYNQQQQLAENRYQSALQTYAVIKWSDQ